MALTRRLPRSLDPPAKRAKKDEMIVRFFGGPMHGKVAKVSAVTGPLVFAEPDLNAEYHYILEIDGNEYRAFLKTIFSHDRAGAIMLGLPVKPE
jgi:hypothetical protein